MIPFFLGDPDASVIAEGLGHEGELGLVITGHGNAGRMDLRVAGIGKGRTTLEGAPCRGDIAASGIGGEVEGRAVAAGAEEDGVGGVALDLAGQEVAGDDALCVAVDQHNIEHFRVLVHGDASKADLVAESGVGTEK